MHSARRAIGAPINIWNDHSDAMALKDAGWIMLFAETNQEALDLHIQAVRLAEEVSCPVMVCVDGFVLTHAYERVDLPSQEQVDAFLPPFAPQTSSIGAILGGAFAALIAQALLQRTHSTTAITLYLLAVTAVACSATLLLRERRGIDLRPGNEDQQSRGIYVWQRRADA